MIKPTIKLIIDFINLNRFLNELITWNMVITIWG